MTVYPLFLERFFDKDAYNEDVSLKDVENTKGGRAMLWREDEIETLLVGIKKFGRKWHIIAENYGAALRHRSPKQLKDKWRRMRYLDEKLENMF
tara:strand:- start:428 stop:709 length:282 start_codon:yes stop_codon:yes gene_type:complete